jgi:subfamily B ATP-binding cassette protein HlyB/CyaB
MLMDASANLRSLVDFLSSVEIFSGFTRDELERLAEHTESRFFQFGETVCNAAEPAEGLFVIKSGSVRIFTEERGKEVSMGMRKEREVFAEIAMLRDYRHESSVRASAKTELLFIPRKVIAPILAENAAAQAFVTSYVAISSAGGFVARLFDLRGKVSKSELEE